MAWHPCCRLACAPVAPPRACQGFHTSCSRIEVVHVRLTDNKGLTLIELLIVVVIVTTIAAIAIPGLLRAKMSGTEASAIGSLRAIISAEGAFASTCGAGYYSPTLVLLGTPPPASSDGFIGSELANDPATKTGYLVTLTPGAPAATSGPSCNGGAAGSLVPTYFVSANPINTPSRYFGTNQGGTIYYASAAIAVTQSGAPAGATPIQ
ncbi:MAG: prepilin-type N-terminal cleavage/methylation domain-containing protein [Acidobacteria bacterium]|nr:prepilin-type N-terminal cleavage/methylation domain-containing protein [Acidobacteriota bacterium]